MTPSKKREPNIMYPRLLSAGKTVYSKALKLEAQNVRTRLRFSYHNGFLRAMYRLKTRQIVLTISIPSFGSTAPN